MNPIPVKYRQLSLNNGFTLVEMLVVMVLMGLITSVLFQSLDIIGKLHQRLIPKMKQQQLDTLQERWFRESVSGLVAGGIQAESFQGNSKGFSGLSVTPLHSINNAPAIINWYIAETGAINALHYQQDDHFDWTIHQQPSQSGEVEFLYLNQLGNWQTSWSVERKPKLPEAIALKKNNSELTEQWWIAMVNGEKQVPFWLYDND